MNDRIRQLFEENTVPNFGNADLIKTSKGEYRDSTLEDHWQTFQEAAELIIKECAEIADDYDPTGSIQAIILQHFGVE